MRRVALESAGCSNFPFSDIHALHGIGQFGFEPDLRYAHDQTQLPAPVLGLPKAAWTVVIVGWVKPTRRLPMQFIPR